MTQEAYHESWQQKHGKYEGQTVGGIALTPYSNDWSLGRGTFYIDVSCGPEYCSNCSMITITHVYHDNECFGKNELYYFRTHIPCSQDDLRALQAYLSVVLNSANNTDAVAAATNNDSTEGR